jgi:hypothetical protein
MLHPYGGSLRTEIETLVPGYTRIPLRFTAADGAATPIGERWIKIELVVSGFVTIIPLLPLGMFSKAGVVVTLTLANSPFNWKVVIFSLLFYRRFKV